MKTLRVLIAVAWILALPGMSFGASETVDKLVGEAKKKYEDVKKKLTEMTQTKNKELTAYTKQVQEKLKKDLGELKKKYDEQSKSLKEKAKQEIAEKKKQIQAELEKVKKELGEKK